MAAPRDWIAAARPRTLPAAIAPVAVGIGLAYGCATVSAWRAVLCGVVALALQVATNYANDYADGVRGTDTVRVGPTRLTAAGLAAPAAVKRAAIACFAVAAVAGAVIALSRSPWLFAIGAASILAGWAYTGGRHPYGYVGLGEVAVFVFFGMVAVTGTVYAVAGSLPGLAFVVAVPMGLCAVALLVVNNLRDIPTDALAGKRTLAVRLGAPRTRVLYAVCLVVAFGTVPFVAIARPTALIALVAVLLAVRPIRRVRSGAEGRDLIRALAATGLLQLTFGALLAVGVAT